MVRGETEGEARKGMRASSVAEDEEDAIVDTDDLIVFQPVGAIEDEHGPSGDDD